MYKELTLGECAERLISIGDCEILIHVRPDGDAVGTACALSLVLRQLGHKSEVVCCDPVSKRLGFILENAGVSIKHERSALPAISVDSASPSQLGALYSEENPISLMIDHHKSGIPYADNFILPDASSAGEVVYLVANELISMGKITMDKPLASALYTSISSDTGRFAYSNTSPETMRIAASLMEMGVDTAEINHLLFSTKTKEQIKAEGIIASSIKSTANGRIAYAALPIKLREENGLSESDFETAIDVVRSLEGAEIALFLRETTPGKYKASIRSTKKEIVSVANRFCGGGHAMAAGCSPTADSIEEALDALLTALTAHVLGD